jgi:hypothetical protein
MPIGVTGSVANNTAVLTLLSLFVALCFTFPLLKALGLINHSIPYRTMYSVLTSIINIILEIFPLTGNIGLLHPTQHMVGIFVPSTLGVSDVYLTLWAYCRDSTDRQKRKPVSGLETETRFHFQLSRNGNGYVLLYRFKQCHQRMHIKQIDL